MTLINAEVLSNFVSLQCLSSLLNALLQYTMAEQNVPTQPPTRTDEQIVPRSQWLTIGKSNLLFNAQKIQKNPIFQISVDILSNTNFFQAFTASANVPAIYLQQFWNTMKYNEKTGVYSCQVDEQWFDLSADLLRKALAITPVNPTHPFELPPSGDTVIDFVNELGYPEPVEIVSSIRVNYVYQPWRAILSLLNQCLTGKTSGSDKPRHPVLQMLWGIVTQTNVDHAELIWEEFTQGIQTFFSHKASHKASLKNPKKKVTPLLIPYGRFSKVIIYYLASNNNIHRRPDSAVHHTGDDYILGNLKFVPKGESVEVFGMAIPDPLITEAIQQSSYYPKYLKMVAENTKKTPQESASAKKIRKGKGPTFNLLMKKMKLDKMYDPDLVLAMKPEESTEAMAGPNPEPMIEDQMDQTLEITCVSLLYKNPEQHWMMNSRHSYQVHEQSEDHNRNERVIDNNPESHLFRRHTANLIEKYSVLPGLESIQNQESEKSPKEIIKAKKEQGEEKQDSTYSIRSTDKVDLEEFDLIGHSIKDEGMTQIWRNGQALHSKVVDHYVVLSRFQKARTCYTEPEWDNSPPNDFWDQNNNWAKAYGPQTTEQEEEALQRLIRRISFQTLWVESEREYDISAVYGITHWWFRRKEFYINKHSEPSDCEAVRSQMRILSVISVKSVGKLMRLNELHKFSDGTLTRVLEKLDHMVKDFHLFEYNKGMETRKWSEDDKRRSKDFITAIEKRLQIRRIYRSLESFVGGRIRDIDYRLINRTT
ncbi:hypothetical protein Tco_0836806 [Tanacetum coccineum]